MSKLALAISIASSGFVTKTDKAGKPYILHCLRVMNGVDQDDEELMCIAALHDCVEDDVCTIQDLIDHGFSPRVYMAIDVLTHKSGMPYDDYIKLVSNYPDCVKVKLSDLKDNSDITRLKGLRKKDFERIEKYHRAFVYLNNN